MIMRCSWRLSSILTVSPGWNGRMRLFVCVCLRQWQGTNGCYARTYSILNSCSSCSVHSGSVCMIMPNCMVCGSLAICLFMWLRIAAMYGLTHSISRWMRHVIRAVWLVFHLIILVRMASCGVIRCTIGAACVSMAMPSG